MWTRRSKITVAVRHGASHLESQYLGELDKRVVSSKLALHYVIRPCLKSQRKIRGGERGRRGRGKETEEEEMA